MLKLAFCGNSETPAKLLEMFKPLTPNKSGIWNNKLIGVANYSEADIFGVIDYIPDNLKNQVDAKRSVFLGAHPEEMQAYHNFDGIACLAKADCKNTIGFLETWLCYDYDYLKALQPPTKTQLLSAIVSDARSQSYHVSRLEWLSRFSSRSDLPSFDLWGRIRPTGSLQTFYRGACGHLDGRGFATSGLNHMIGKEEVLANTKYSLEFDATGRHYFSERLVDALLMWVYPIYWGGRGVHNYLPRESFAYLDINGSGDDVLSIVNSDTYEKALPAIAEARHIILDKLLIWGRIQTLLEEVGAL